MDPGGDLLPRLDSGNFVVQDTSTHGFDRENFSTPTIPDHGFVHLHKAANPITWSTLLHPGRHLNREGLRIKQSPTPPNLRPPPESLSLAPPPGFNEPESNLTEIGWFADSSALMGGVASSSFISNSKYLTPARSLGHSFLLLPPVSTLYECPTKPTILSLPLEN